VPEELLDLHLTGRELSLLYLLAANAGQVVRREAIRDMCWIAEVLPDNRLVEQVIWNLRAKGIPAEVQDGVFEAYDTTKGEQGTGLGLALVRGVVQRHGGLIAIKSTVGRSTTFRIALPAQAGVEAAPRVELAHSTSAVRPLRLGQPAPAATLHQYDGHPSRRGGCELVHSR
jgi:hypothetical protein